MSDNQELQKKRQGSVGNQNLKQVEGLTLLQYLTTVIKDWHREKVLTVDCLSAEEPNIA